MKTLAQCIKLRPVPVATTASEPSSSKGLVSSAEPFNALLLANPKFGLTIDELRSDLHPEFLAGGFVEFDISFLPSGDIIVKPLPTHFLASHKLELSIQSLKSAVAKKVKQLDLAKDTVMCAVDGSSNVVRREDYGVSGGGWSQVAKGVGRRVVEREREVGYQSGFAVLGRAGGKEKGREVKREETVDDWEREVEGWGDS